MGSRAEVVGFVAGFSSRLTAKFGGFDQSVTSIQTGIPCKSVYIIRVTSEREAQASHLV